jgi:predicted amidohydrolase YtcJ
MTCDEPADLILHAGKLTTLDPANRSATAMAVKGDRILAVGTDEQALKRFRGPQTTVIDLGRRRAVPGLTDTHTHLIRGGLSFNMELRRDGVPSLADALRMLREQARRRSGCGSAAAGAKSSSPNGGCPRWRRSTPPHPIDPCSSCTCTIGRY